MTSSELDHVAGPITGTDLPTTICCRCRRPIGLDGLAVLTADGWYHASCDLYADEQDWGGATYRTRVTRVTKRARAA